MPSRAASDDRWLIEMVERFSVLQYISKKRAASKRRLFDYIV